MKRANDRPTFLFHPELVLGLLLVLLIASVAPALIMVQKGNEPTQDHNWPAGSLDVANLKTRVDFWEGPPFGGGQYCFEFRGDTAAFQAALDAFAKIKAPSLELYVHEGPHESFVLRDPKDPKADAHVDWSFTVWNPESWNRLYGKPGHGWNAEDPNFGKPMAAPRMDVWAGPGGIDWSKVKVPQNVTVDDDRASSHGYRDGSAIVGDVLDMGTSKPIPGAKVTIQRNNGQDKKTLKYVYETVAETKTDDAGHFELKSLPEGTFQVVASASGVASRVVGYEAFGKNTFRKYTVKLSPAASISGRVEDTDGKPVAGTHVRADSIMSDDGRGYEVPDRPEATTDAEGKFTIDGLPHGHCHLFAYDDHHFLLDAMKVRDVPSTDVSLKVTATGSIKVKVVRLDGTPANDAQVSVEREGGAKIGNWGGSANLKPDGTYQFDQVPPAKYVVSINPGLLIQNKDPDAKTIEVTAGNTVEVEFTKK